MSPPAFDSGVRIYTSLLAPIALAALIIAPIPFVQDRFQKRILALGVLTVTLTLAVITVTGYTYASKSGFYANIVGVVIAATAAFTTVTLAATSPHKALKKFYRVSLLALALIGIALSAPHACNTGYFEDLTVKIGEGVDGIRLYEASYDVKGDHVDVMTVLERDRVFREATESIISKIAGAVFSKENVENAERILEELGFRKLVEGVKIDDMTFEWERGKIRVSNASFILRSINIDNGTLMFLELRGDLWPNLEGYINLSKPHTVDIDNALSAEIHGIIIVNGTILLQGFLEGSSKVEVPMVIEDPYFRAYALYLDSEKAREIYELAKLLNGEGLLNRCLIDVKACNSMLPERVPRV